MLMTKRPLPWGVRMLVRVWAWPRCPYPALHPVSLSLVRRLLPPLLSLLIGRWRHRPLPPLREGSVRDPPWRPRWKKRRAPCAGGGCPRPSISACTVSPQPAQPLPVPRALPGAPGDGPPIAFPAVPPDPEPEAEASVLLVGAAEGRHLLMTAARARRGTPRDITVRTGTGRGRGPGTAVLRGSQGTGAGGTSRVGVIPVLPGISQVFVAEQSPEPVARQLLFLLLALEAPERSRPSGTGTPR